MGNNGLISLKKNFRAKFPNDIIFMHVEQEKNATTSCIGACSSCSNRSTTDALGGCSSSTTSSDCELRPIVSLLVRLCAPSASEFGTK